jgi:uncharacterized Zn finger protein
VAKSNSQQSEAGKQGQSPNGGWAKLTWDDLENWAGSRAVSRGRTYQRGGHVSDLKISADGDLLATVVGGDRYATTVSLKSGTKGRSLDSACTCPVGISCKHAVATVAQYLQAIADGKQVPLASEDDPRWDKLEAGGDWDDDDDDGDDDQSWDDDEDEDDDEEEEVPVKKARASRPKSPAKGSAASWDDKIERHIRDKTQGELADLVWSLTRRFPEIYQEFRERIALQSGDVAQLLAEARREIRQVTSEPAWTNHWNDEGHIPDYSPIRHRFERLLELGHADEVVSLGREFIEKGLRQVNEAHDDEGEIAQGFADCLPVIFQAVMQSSLSPAERLLLAIDTLMADDFDTVDEATNPVLDATWKPEDWSSVADTLAGRLKSVSAGGSLKNFGSISDYKRDSLTRWIAEALQEAGRVEEVTKLYESEAKVTGSYERLVNHLLHAGLLEDAERWAREGIAATSEKLPGISGQLAEKLCEFARKRKQWDVVAAHAATKFFDRPGLSSFDELIKAAKQAGVEALVREAALRFLETGVGPFQATSPPKAVTPAHSRSLAKKKSPATPPKAPDSGASGRRLKVDPAWPLPMPDYLIPLIDRRPAYDPGPRPHLDVLLEMAIAAKDPDEVLRWFDKMRKEPQRPAYYYSAMSYADRVADAVSASHPERTLEIYTAALNAQLPQAHPSAYENAAGYLRKLRPVYKALGRAAEWNALVASIRDKYRNRPRFMEILDRLDGKTILDSAKPKRK